MANDKFCVNDGKPYFSDSAEHGSEPLCAACYKAWLENRDLVQLQKLQEQQAMLEAKIEAKKKIAAAQGAKK